MAGLSRRRFIAATAGLAAAWGLPQQTLGAALAAPLRPADVPTTLRETIRQRSVGTRQYRTLATAPGEPYIPRYDLLGKVADSARATRRRSLVYLGHMTDIHIMDAQSPARLEPMAAQSPSTWQGSIRPQDALTVHVQAQMVAAMNAARFSPVTGAPMAAVFNTGDSADQHSMLELRWYIDAMDGVPVTPDSGAPGQYEGPQVWDEATYAWHPEAPDSDSFGAYGFPRIPGMLTAAVSDEVRSEGLLAPWYAVYGNHDTVYYGAFPIGAALHELAVGSRKPVLWQDLAQNYLAGMAADSTILGRLEHDLRTQFGRIEGFRTVTPDPNRKMFEQVQFMAEHFATQPQPGPVGHGFTQANLDTNTGYWAADIGPHLRLFGLDTCNQVMGADGAVPQDQFDWLQDQLTQARDQNKLAIVLSHHNSKTLENTAVAAVGESQPLIHTEQFIDMLLQFPNLIAWSNGHTHINTIVAHPREDGAGGFWELTAASCIDYPQQQQLLEVVDNRDGTLSIFATTLDHASGAAWRDGDFSQAGLASLSRELASNDWIADPLIRLGSPLDRNVELLLPAPFDLARISDTELEKETMRRKATLLGNARSGGVS